MGFYPCRDGEAFIICPEQAQWQRMASLIGAPEWGASEMFASRDERGAHAAEIQDRVSAWTRSRTSEEVFHALQERHCPSHLTVTFSQDVHTNSVRDLTFDMVSNLLNVCQP